MDSTKVHDTARSVDDIAEKGMDAANAVGDRVHEAASQVSDKARALAAALASAIGDKARVVAAELSQCAHRTGELGENLANLMKRNPVPSVLVGIGIGFLLARVTRK